MTISRAELQDAVRKAFGEGGLAPDAAQSWDQFVEMGFLGLTVPEEMGGLGLGHEALMAIHYELGRALVPGAFIGQMMAVDALAVAGSNAWADRAMGGERITCPLLLQGPDWVGGKLNGTLAGVSDADLATHALVIANGRELCALVPLDAPVVSMTERPLWDETRRLFDVTITDYAVDPALIIAQGEPVRTLAARLKAHMCLALAADSLGGADAILAFTIDYLQTRKQFDRPLAMFQALKHRCADLKTLLTAAEALLWSRTTEAPLTQLGALKAHATSVYRTIAEEAIQLHGGIGLTQEHHCHLFLKRAMLNAALGGDADMWEELAGRNALRTLLA
jgi:alkylation response protein AidB-like acyl-CoA dehydrogenase